MPRLLGGTLDDPGAGASLPIVEHPEHHPIAAVGLVVVCLTLVGYIWVSLNRLEQRKLSHPSI